MARIYVSSSYTDLIEQREAIYRVLRQLGHDVIAMEDYVASDQRPLDRCLEDVARSDIYVGVIAWRYGYVPEGTTSSITELEFRQARKCGIPTLIFVLDENAPWPRNKMDQPPTQIERLRQELTSTLLVTVFQGTLDLSAKVSISVVRQLDARPHKQGITNSATPSTEELAPKRIEFKEVLTDFQQLGSLALMGAVAAPLADIWLKLGPPPAEVIGVLTALVEFVAVVYVFQFWSNTKERKLRVRMLIALGIFLVGLVSSFGLLQRFTVSPGQGRDRVVEGYSLRSDVKPIVNESYTPEQALRESEYDPDKVWTKESIAVLRALITVTWMSTFAGFAVYLTVFIILQRLRHPVSPIQEPSH